MNKIKNTLSCLLISSCFLATSGSFADSLPAVNNVKSVSDSYDSVKKVVIKKSGNNYEMTFIGLGKKIYVSQNQQDTQFVLVPVTEFVNDWKKRKIVYQMILYSELHHMKYEFDATEVTYKAEKNALKISGDLVASTKITNIYPPKFAAKREGADAQIPPQVLEYVVLKFYADPAKNPTLFKKTDILDQGPNEPPI